MLASNADMASGLPVIDARHKEVAIALRYDSCRDAAPVVTATRHGAVAARIVDIARDHGVKVGQEADLARVLEPMEDGQAITHPSFTAVD